MEGFPIKGDLNVLRSIYAGRRVNQGINVEVITAQVDLGKDSAAIQHLSAAAGQDCVLPDATTLDAGWKVVVKASGASAIAVKTYHATTPVLLKSVASGDTYEFTLTNNGSAAGTWVYSQSVVTSAPYTSSFDATTSWGSASGGFYTITVTAATHGKGATPIFQLYELSGSDYLAVGVYQASFNGSGDISIKVPETPSGRFAGLLVVQR